MLPQLPYGTCIENHLCTLVHYDAALRQWEHIDCANLTKSELHFGNLLDELVLKLQKFTSLHFIAKHQGEFFSAANKNLDGDTCLIILDFAKNYSLIVQYAIQSFH